MQVRPFKHSDIHSVNKWLKRHNQPLATLSEIPSIGFIVPGVAAGFLRNCENSIGMIDSYATNPLCSQKSRHSALEAITKALLAEPFKYFITMTADEGLQKRFNKHGLQALPNYIWMAKVGN